MRVTGQPVAAQKLQIVELLAHALDGFALMVTAVYEELADYLSATVALFVKINFALFHAEDAELRGTLAEAYLRQNIIHQIRMQRIARGEVAKILMHGCRSNRPACWRT